jgi:glycosyltransferase involved in cell wall biosynthesis
MRIAVNMRLLIKDHLDGIGFFTHETFSRIVKQHPEHEFLFIFDRPYDVGFIYADNVKPVVIRPAARHPFLFLLQYRFLIPLYLAFNKVDLYIGPDGFLPAFLKTKKLAVIHDLNFEHHPELLPGRYRRMYKRIFPKYARWADRIATVSEFSKQDIVINYGVPHEKIDVVYNGASDHFIPLDTADRQMVRNKYCAGSPYFIHVGTLHPRKNIARLFEAWDIFKDSNVNNTKLVLAGAKMWWTKDLERAWNKMKHKKDVVFTGRISNEELAALVASSRALLLVSVFEGFGIPLIEAFKCGTPAITSNVTSLPEVAGDAAILTDPFKPEAMAEALQQMNNDKTLRTVLKENALKRASVFTWDKTATKLWESIEKVLKAEKG